MKIQKLGRKRNPSHCRLRLECLESRAMLAGNVLASVNSAGNLTITGTNAANQIEITQLAANSYLITGTDTTVNGETEFQVDNVRGSLTVDLKGGADTFTFTGAVDEDFSSSFTGSILILGGSGNDTIAISNVAAANLTVIGGQGADQVTIDTATLRGTLLVTTEAGVDTVG